MGAMRKNAKKKAKQRAHAEIEKPKSKPSWRPRNVPTPWPAASITGTCHLARKVSVKPSAEEAGPSEHRQAFAIERQHQVRHPRGASLHFA